MITIKLSLEDPLSENAEVVEDTEAAESGVDDIDWHHKMQLCETRPTVYVMHNYAPVVEFDAPETGERACQNLFWAQWRQSFTA